MIIKKLSFLSGFLLIIGVLTSQAQIGSTYSMFGLGDVASSGFGQNRAMGGIGVGLRSNQHLNTINPASYTTLDSMSVIYELGLSTGFNYVETSSSNTTKQDANIDYFALGFKVKKYWGMGFGLTPTTRVNYTLLSQSYSNDIGSYDTYYYGDGGLSKVFWTNSFVPFENLSIGIEANYVFGQINRITSVMFNDLTSFTNNSKYEHHLNVYNLSFSYGIQYTAPVNKDNKFIIGLVYQNKMKMNSKVSVFGITTKGTEYTKGIDFDIQENYIVDTIASIEDKKSTLTLPSSLGAGLTFNHKDNLIIGTDIKLTNWSELKSEEILEQYKNSISYMGGLEWTPDVNSVNSYLKRIRYRMGGHYTQSHLVINSQRINDFGASFGFGLPIRNSNTTFNISGEFGQRGTTNENLLRETYGIVSLNLSLSDIWFFKRKYK